MQFIKNKNFLTSVLIPNILSLCDKGYQLQPRREIISEKHFVQ